MDTDGCTSLVVFRLGENPAARYLTLEVGFVVQRVKGALRDSLLLLEQPVCLYLIVQPDFYA